MQNLSNKVLWGVALVAVVLGFVAVSKPGQVVIKQVATSLGSVASPDIMSPYFSYGGVRMWASKTTLQTATTTVCALVSPAATSSLTSFGLGLVVGSTTSMTITVASSTSAFATTSTLSSTLVAANTSKEIAYIGGSKDVFFPNTFVVVSMQGGTGTFSPTGTCQATFTQLSY